jgi:hypothetical protein
MVKLYKASNNGEMIVVTDVNTLPQFIAELSDATLNAIHALEGDEEHTLRGILANAFDVAFKLQGYKADKVIEKRLLTCGFTDPSECHLVADEHREYSGLDHPESAAEEDLT